MLGFRWKHAHMVLQRGHLLGVAFLRRMLYWCLWLIGRQNDMFSLTCGQGNVRVDIFKVLDKVVRDAENFVP